MTFLGNRHPHDPAGRVVAVCNEAGLTFDGIVASKGGYIAAARRDGKVVAAVLRPTREAAAFSLAQIIRK